MQQVGLQKYSIIFIPILFLLYSAPSALDFVFHFPDEKYYTDAVIQMMDKDDYFTPYQADGTPRFKKPIITYWVLIGSYKLFGVSRFSSRIFFWLAGAILVAISFLMAKSITGDKKLATLTAFITAANPLVLLSASRSIPDILLVLFLTISAWGFLEIMLAETPQKKYYWFAYLGVALAFETKGFPAAAFAGASMLFLLLNPWKKIKFRQLFEPLSFTVAILAAISWFLIMYIKHGAEYWNLFFEDQVGERISSKTAQIFKNTGLGIVNLVAFLIPWIFIIFSKPSKLWVYFADRDKSTKAVIGFILSWTILIIVMSGAVFKFYDRYLLPVIPLVSLLIASIITESKTGFRKTILKIFLILNLMVLTINVLYALFIFPDSVLIIGSIFSVVIFACYFKNIFKNISTEVLIANAFMLLFFNVFILLYPLLMPNPGKQLVENLHKHGISVDDKIYVYGNIRAASNIRIHCSNGLNVVSMDTIFVLPNEPNHFLVFNKKETYLLDLKGYDIFDGSEEWKRVPTDKFPSFLGKAIKKLKENSTKYSIAKPK